jgi:hypothetical protein
MTQLSTASTSRTWPWALLLLVLLALRVPSLAQPAGGDQGLYRYVGQRIAAGEVPYRDAFEQKPPGVFVVYAVMSRVWPGETVVAGADLIAAGLAAWLLVTLGRRLWGGRVGEIAAALFLVLGDPGIQRLAGVHVRAQCETFIAVAVTAALVLLWREDRRAVHGLMAGAALGAAFWLKYNALVFALPIGLAAVLAPAASRRDTARSLMAIAFGAAGIFAGGVAWFAAHGALTDLWLGTVAYNLQYSGETYAGPGDALVYLLTFPLAHARVDGLWFIGGLGVLCLIVLKRFERASLVVLAWVAAACLSMAINGSRGLPQYFLQAAPALALAGAAGLVAASRMARRNPTTRLVAILTGAVLVAGAWRVGTEPGAVWRPRLFGVPQAAANFVYDLRRVTGDISEETYLARFDRGEGGKYSPAAVRRLADRVRETTASSDPIYVFGFASGGVLAAAERRSASRFFWSRPVILEFAADRPGYGSSGLLQDLQARPPALVALQRRDWGLAEASVPSSLDYFMRTPALRAWLEAGYAPDSQDDLFVVWRRRN